MGVLFLIFNKNGLGLMLLIFFYRFFPLNQYEWGILKNQYSCDEELRVTRLENQNLGTSIGK